MRAARLVLPVLLMAVHVAPVAIARTLPEVQAMVESKASGALSAAEALTRETPNDANAWVMLTRARMQARQSEKAVVSAEKAAALGPKNAQER